MRAYLPLAAGVMIAVATAATSAGAHAIIPASVDTGFSTDLDIRRANDPGMIPFIAVGSARGDVPSHGRADAMRTIIRFDVSRLTQPVARARLELTIHSFDDGDRTSSYTVNVHRILPAPLTSLRFEGYASRWPNSTASGQHPRSIDADGAFGTSPAGCGESLDPYAADNPSEPPFDPRPVAHATICQDTHPPGTVIRWDITTLVNAWIAGMPNEGILLRYPKSDTPLGGVRFGAREGWHCIFPQIVLVDRPRLDVALHSEPESDSRPDATPAQANNHLEQMTNQVKALRSWPRQALRRTSPTDGLPSVKGEYHGTETSDSTTSVLPRRR
jgi:hypothetical protein